MENKTHTFAAINRHVESNIVSGKEYKESGRDYVSWGEGNAFPAYLESLYDNCATLHSVINGTVDFICGDDIILNWENGRPSAKTTIREFVQALAYDDLIYGGYAFEVRRANGKIVSLDYLDIRYLRTNEDRDTFYYSEDFGKKYGRASKAVVLPSFFADPTAANSVVYVTRPTKGVYPTPLYAASVKAAEMERQIDTFHLNALANGFSGSYIFNFNNGVPSDEIREEITRDIEAKFCGTENAGRVITSWNDNVTARMTVERLEIDDFGTKYAALQSRSRQQIFTAFRANPNLFGIPTENNGFSNEEYSESFKLYNRTMVRPAQRMLAETLELVLGVPGVLVIKPFSLEIETESNIN